MVEPLTALEQPRPAESVPAQPSRPFVRKSSIDDLLADVKVNGKTMVIERQEIEQSLEATRSPMPDGLLDTLSREEVLDLIGLLRR